MRFKGQYDRLENNYTLVLHPGEGKYAGDKRSGEEEEEEEEEDAGNIAFRRDSDIPEIESDGEL